MHMATPLSKEASTVAADGRDGREWELESGAGNAETDAKVDRIYKCAPMHAYWLKNAVANLVARKLDRRIIPGSYAIPVIVKGQFLMN